MPTEAEPLQVSEPLEVAEDTENAELDFEQSEFQETPDLAADEKSEHKDVVESDDDMTADFADAITGARQNSVTSVVEESEEPLSNNDLASAFDFPSTTPDLSLGNDFDATPLELANPVSATDFDPRLDVEKASESGISDDNFEDAEPEPEDELDFHNQSDEEGGVEPTQLSRQATVTKSSVNHPAPGSLSSPTEESIDTASHAEFDTSATPTTPKFAVPDLQKRSTNIPSPRALAPPVPMLQLTTSDLVSTTLETSPAYSEDYYESGHEQEEAATTEADHETSMSSDDVPYYPPSSEAHASSRALNSVLEADATETASEHTVQESATPTSLQEAAVFSPVAAAPRSPSEAVRSPEAPSTVESEIEQPWTVPGGEKYPHTSPTAAQESSQALASAIDSPAEGHAAEEFEPTESESKLQSPISSPVTSAATVATPAPAHRSPSAVGWTPEAPSTVDSEIEQPWTVPSAENYPHKSPPTESSRALASVLASPTSQIAEDTEDAEPQSPDTSTVPSEALKTPFSANRSPSAAAWSPEAPSTVESEIEQPWTVPGGAHYPHKSPSDAHESSRALNSVLESSEEPVDEDLQPEAELDSSNTEPASPVAVAPETPVRAHRSPSAMGWTPEAPSTVESDIEQPWTVPGGMHYPHMSPTLASTESSRALDSVVKSPDISFSEAGLKSALKTSSPVGLGLVTEPDLEMATTERGIQSPEVEATSQNAFATPAPAHRSPSAVAWTPEAPSTVDSEIEQPWTAHADAEYPHKSPTSALESSRALTSVTSSPPPHHDDRSAPAAALDSGLSSPTERGTSVEDDAPRCDPSSPATTDEPELEHEFPSPAPHAFTTNRQEFTTPAPAHNRSPSAVAWTPEAPSTVESEIEQPWTVPGGDKYPHKSPVAALDSSRALHSVVGSPVESRAFEEPQEEESQESRELVKEMDDQELQDTSAAVSTPAPAHRSPSAVAWTPEAPSTVDSEIEQPWTAPASASYPHESPSTSVLDSSRALNSVLNSPEEAPVSPIEVTVTSPLEKSSPMPPAFKEPAELESAPVEVTADEELEHAQPQASHDHDVFEDVADLEPVHQKDIVEPGSPAQSESDGDVIESESKNESEDDDSVVFSEVVAPPPHVDREVVKHSFDHSESDGDVIDSESEDEYEDHQEIPAASVETLPALDKSVTETQGSENDKPAFGFDFEPAQSPVAAKLSPESLLPAASFAQFEEPSSDFASKSRNIDQEKLENEFSFQDSKSEVAETANSGFDFVNANSEAEVVNEEAEQESIIDTEAFTEVLPRTQDASATELTSEVQASRETDAVSPTASLGYAEESFSTSEGSFEHINTSEAASHVESSTVDSSFADGHPVDSKVLGPLETEIEAPETPRYTDGFHSTPFKTPDVSRTRHISLGLSDSPQHPSPFDPTDKSLETGWDSMPSRSDLVAATPSSLAASMITSPAAPSPRSPDSNFAFPLVTNAAGVAAATAAATAAAVTPPSAPSRDATPVSFNARDLANEINTEKSLPATPKSTASKPFISSNLATATNLGSQRTPSVVLKPINKEPEVVEDVASENPIFAVCVVGFHHSRGPEVEYWRGVDGDQSKVWPNLPFQSLPDGSHSHEENFCYFTMLYDQATHTAPISVPKRDKEGNVIQEATDMKNVTTLFGISCNRQISSDELKNRPADVTRSAVHKSVVVIARKPIFGPVREKLAVITRAFFQQGDFSDLSLIDNLYDSLTSLFSVKLDENTLYFGMSLRELIYRLGSSVLVVLKALLLEKKIVFYSRNTEVLCASQFSLVSLIPALLDNMEDCCSPLLHNFENNAKKALSLRSSDRKSLLSYMGLPLQPFAKGGMFNPYVPLQQLDELKAPETEYFMVGSTNSLLMESKLADLVVNMDDDSVEIRNSSLKNVLSLSASDKKWMDSVVSTVVDTWDPEDPWRPKGLGFQGSEDFVRQQFEDYIMGLISSVKYDIFLSRFGNNPPKSMTLREVDGNPIKLFNMNWVNMWRTTNNFRIFSGITDTEIFDIVEPRHMVVSLSETHERKPSAASFLSNKSDGKDKTAVGAAAAARARPPRTRIGKAWGNFWWGSQDQGTAQPPHGPSASVDSRSTATTGEYEESSDGAAADNKNAVSSTVLEPVISEEEPTTTTKPDSDAAAATTSPTSPSPQKKGMFTGWSLWGSKTGTGGKPPSTSSFSLSDGNPASPVSTSSQAVTTNPFSPAYAASPTSLASPR